MRGGVNKWALASFAVLAVWAVVVVGVHLQGELVGSVPHQFDYDTGVPMPTAAQEHVSAVEAVVLMLSLPVAGVSLWLAYRASTVSEGQVYAVVAAVVAGFACLAGIGCAAVGVGVFVFFT